MGLLDDIKRGGNNDALVKMQIELSKQGEYLDKLITIVEENMGDITVLKDKLDSFKEEIAFIKGATQGKVEVNTNVETDSGNVTATQNTTTK